ncbi:MAG: 50S ribosomal protein L28 [Dehalococcoidia bacterium]|nr:50S ribosomal protein L28 [Dehalococcoidia bacterium]
MAGKCDVCGKGPQFGHNVSHSKRHTNRRWEPNTQKATLSIKGVAKRLNVCTRCIRTSNKVAKAS